MAEACARFESEWRRGDRPRIEDSTAAAGTESEALLSRLLPLELALRLEAGESPTPDDYRARFPASRGLVEAAFAGLSTVVDATVAAPAEARIDPETAANLLIGVLALQNGFIDHVALIAAIRSWAADRSRGLADALIAGGMLDARRVKLLEPLAEEHRRRFGDDLPRSLGSFGSLAPVLRAVAGMGDPAIETGMTLPPETTILDDEATTAREGGPGGPDDAPRDPPGPGWSSSRFQVLSFHDAGMLGKVFIALDRELNRKVALKEIQKRHAHHPVSRDQFVLEGMITGSLEHPGIVPVYSLGTREDGGPFYAMRFIQGPSLRDKLKQLHRAEGAAPLAPGEEPPTLPRLLRHFVGACHAMAYAHGRGVLHRDLKPEHIMLGPFGETLIVDWGLAMPTPGGGDAPDSTLEFPAGRDAALSRDSVVVGTLPYMSPEQASGMQSTLDRRADVYALGAILFAMLTGRAPIQGKDFASMLTRAREGDFPRPREVARDAPPALEAICLKAMARERADRYATATDLARDVERWLDGEPTVAYPEPFPARAGRWLRKHRTAAVAAAVALVCVAIGLVALSFRMAAANIEIARERDRAQEARIAAEEARGAAEEARREAEAMLGRSVAMFRNVLLPVASTTLPRTPASVELRRLVARGASEYLEGIRERRPDDPEIRYQAGRGYREVAKIAMLMGEPDDEPNARAVELLRDAVAARPDAPRYADVLAETLQQVGGSLLLAGKVAESEAPLREALRLAGTLRALEPASPLYRRTEARASNDLASQRLADDDAEEAARLAESAWLAMRPFADSAMPGRTDRLEVVNILDTLGDARAAAGGLDGAVEAFTEGIRRGDALIAEGAEEGSIPYLRALLHLKRSRALARMDGRGDGAASDADAAVIAFDRLAEIARPVVRYSELLAESLLQRARLHMAAERRDAARADLDRGIAIVERLPKAAADRPARAGLEGRLVGRRALLDVAADDPDAARARLARALARIAEAAAASPRDPALREARAEFEEASRRLPAGE